ncbi:MAG TPA: hypothetical protein VGO52_16340 [Hyphomonadaceae bacterium]|jgi:hypothetical protein|nr:hypothetical protein [Hyphomonadaceae bacterium]
MRKHGFAGVAGLTVGLALTLTPPAAAQNLADAHLSPDQRQEFNCVSFNLSEQGRKYVAANALAPTPNIGAQAQAALAAGVSTCQRTYYWTPTKTNLARVIATQDAVTNALLAILAQEDGATNGDLVFNVWRGLSAAERANFLPGNFNKLTTSSPILQKVRSALVAGGFPNTEQAVARAVRTMMAMTSGVRALNDWLALG